jgi:hypothetical protein
MPIKPRAVIFPFLYQQLALIFQLISLFYDEMRFGDDKKPKKTAIECHLRVVLHPNRIRYQIDRLALCGRLEKI